MRSATADAIDAAGCRDRRAIAVRAAADQAAETAIHDRRPVELDVTPTQPRQQV
jgi:hypothetical protein